MELQPVLLPAYTTSSAVSGSHRNLIRCFQNCHFKLKSFCFKTALSDRTNYKFVTQAKIGHILIWFASMSTCVAGVPAAVYYHIYSPRLRCGL